MSTTASRAHASARAVSANNLLASFISPLTNQRTDEYGGSIEQRMKFPLEVSRACRAVFPAHKPMSVRLSATDWYPGGLTSEELVRVGQLLKEAGALRAELIVI